MALLVTTAVFVAALLAMRTIRVLPFFQTTRDEITPPQVVELIPPPPVVPKPVPVPEPKVAPSKAAPTTVPTTLPPATIPAPPQVVAPIVAAPAAPVGAPPRDSSVNAGAKTRSVTDMVPARDVPNFPAAVPNMRGAPMGTAGVTATRGNLTTAQRDSIITSKLATDMALALKRPYTDGERNAAAANGEPGRALPNTRAGGAAPLMNGGAAVKIPMGSFSLPLFYPGPSPEQRKRDAEIHRQNMVVLHGLQDMVLMHRDSLRRDSLRLDSLRRDSLARKPKQP